MTGKKKVRIQINYKSGISMVIECDEFRIRNTATGRCYEWESAEPNPMHLGADSVESVWQLA